MKRFLIYLIAILFFNSAIAQTVGSKVQLTDATGKTYTGTITEIKDGKYKVKYDGFDFEPWLVEGQFKLTTAPAPLAETTKVSTGKPVVDADNTLSADRPIIECPVQQTKVTDGSRPNAELLKKIIRCRKGEKAAEKGFDGAVTVDVSALEIGIPRKWDYYRDQGTAKAGTTVYPVKATYTSRTFYRTRTEVSENWIRILNFYVDAFGEWTIGSEESIKGGTQKSIPAN